MSGVELRAEHSRCRAEAMRAFQSAKKMGGPELAAQFIDKLDADIQVIFIKIRKFLNIATLRQLKKLMDYRND